MKERTKNILEASLRSFIKTGKPITSGFLYKHYNFGIKPAMIRWELSSLDEAGFMTQVHASGGRVPTNKAYRFFVHSLFEENNAATLKAANIEQIEPVIREFLRGKIRSFVEKVAYYLRVVSVGYESRTGNIYESGLSLLLKQLEAKEKRVLIEVVADIESLEEKFSRLELKNNGPRVFIGEGPFIKSDHISLIVDELNFNRGPFFLCAIGPKRMDYQRSLRFFKMLEELLSK